MENEIRDFLNVPTSLQISRECLLLLGMKLFKGDRADIEVARSRVESTSGTKKTIYTITATE